MEKDFHKRYGKNLQVIGIAIAAHGDPFKLAKQFKVEHGLTYPVLVDAKNSIAAKFGIQATPTGILLDKNGKIVYVEEGFDPGALTKAVNQQIAKK